jgi:hypothetical protein
MKEVRSRQKNTITGSRAWRKRLAHRRLSPRIASMMLVVLGFPFADVVFAGQMEPNPTMKVRVTKYTQATPPTLSKSEREREPGDPTINILVYNQASAPSDILMGAEREAARILSNTGLHTNWFDCSAGHPVAGPQDICQSGVRLMNIELRILAKPAHDTRLGFAIIPSLARLYYDYKARFVSNDVGLGLPMILGCAIAHEVGHLLLGAHSHSGEGVMQAEWGQRQIRQALMKDLFFTPDESRLIRDEARLRMSQDWPPNPTPSSALHQSAGNGKN